MEREGFSRCLGMKGVLWKEIFEKNLNDKRKVQQTKIYKKGAERQTYSGTQEG